MSTNPFRYAVNSCMRQHAYHYRKQSNKPLRIQPPCDSRAHSASAWPNPPPDSQPGASGQSGCSPERVFATWTRARLSVQQRKACPISKSTENKTIRTDLESLSGDPADASRAALTAAACSAGVGADMVACVQSCEPAVSAAAHFSTPQRKACCALSAVCCRISSFLRFVLAISNTTHGAQQGATGGGSVGITLHVHHLEGEDVQHGGERRGRREVKDESESN